MDDVYSEIILDLYHNPVNQGEVKDYDFKGDGGNPSCGDLIVITVKVSGNKVEDIKFQSKGCAISTASASLLTEEVMGKTLEEVKRMQDKDVIDNLGGIIQTRIKCALLPKITLQKVIEAWEKQGKKAGFELKVRV